MNYKLYINRFCKFFCVYLISTKLRGIPSSIHIDVILYLFYLIFHCNICFLLIALCVCVSVCELQALFCRRRETEFLIEERNLKRKHLFLDGMFWKINRCGLLDLPFQKLAGCKWYIIYIIIYIIMVYLYIFSSIMYCILKEGTWKTNHALFCKSLHHLMSQSQNQSTQETKAAICAIWKGIMGSASRPYSFLTCYLLYFVV